MKPGMDGLRENCTSSATGSRNVPPSRIQAAKIPSRIADDIWKEPGLVFLVAQARSHNPKVWEVLADEMTSREMLHKYEGLPPQYGRGSKEEVVRVVLLMLPLTIGYPEFFQVLRDKLGPTEAERRARVPNPLRKATEEEKGKLAKSESLDRFLFGCMVNADVFQIAGLQSEQGRLLNGKAVKVTGFKEAGGSSGGASAGVPLPRLACDVRQPILAEGGRPSSVVKAIKPENLEFRPNISKGDLKDYLGDLMKICKFPTRAVRGTDLENLFNYIATYENLGQTMNCILSTPRYCPCGAAKLLACQRCQYNTFKYSSSQEYLDDPLEDLVQRVLSGEKPVADFYLRYWEEKANRRVGGFDFNAEYKAAMESLKHLPHDEANQEPFKAVMEPLARKKEIDDVRVGKKRLKIQLEMSSAWRKEWVEPYVESNAVKIWEAKKEDDKKNSFFYLVRPELWDKPLLSLFDPCGLKLVVDLAESFVKHRSFSVKTLRAEILPHVAKRRAGKTVGGSSSSEQERSSESLGSEVVRFAANITIGQVLQEYDLSSFTLHSYYDGDCGSIEVDLAKPPDFGRSFRKNEKPLGILFGSALYGYNFWFALSYALSSAEHPQWCGKWRVGSFLRWIPNWTAGRIRRAQKTIKVRINHDFFLQKICNS